MLAKLTSRDAVLDAISEFDEIGRDAFLTKYGFKAAREYFISHDGRLYDSKAIFAAAFGKQHPSTGPLTASVFSGGKKTVKKHLMSLGFSIPTSTHNQLVTAFPAYLLTWNPQKWQWKTLEGDYESCLNGGTVDLDWSCGHTKSIPLGARIYLLRQGLAPKGVMASGKVIKTPFLAKHWDPKKADQKSLMVTVRFDTILHEKCEEFLNPANHATPINKLNTRIQSSGTRIPEEIADALNECWSLFTDSKLDSTSSEEPEFGAIEGEKKKVLVTHRKRENLLREKKLYEAKKESPNGKICCQVPGCGFDFEAVYGIYGTGYAQVHHLHPLSLNVGATKTTLSDLMVVCANCHAMIHRGGGCRPPETLIKCK